MTFCSSACSSFSGDAAALSHRSLLRQRRILPTPVRFRPHACCQRPQGETQWIPNTARRDILLLGALAFGLSTPRSSFAEVSRESSIRAAKDVYAAYAKGDIAPFLDLVADNVKFTSSWNGTPLTIKGKAAFKKWLSETLPSSLEFTSYQPIKFYSDGDGDEVAVVVQSFGTGKVSGKPFKCSFVSTFIFNEEGQVFIIKEYTDTKLLAEILA